MTETRNDNTSPENICKLLDITYDEFHTLVKKGLPSVEKNKYSATQCVKFYINFLRQEKYIVGVEKLAEIFAMRESEHATARWISVLVKDFGMPKLERGRYDLLACTKWYIKYLSKKLPTQENATKGEEEKRLTIVRRQIKEVELAKMQEELITLQDVLQILSELFSSLGNSFASIPNILAMEVPDDFRPEVKLKIEKIIMQLQNEFSTIPEALKRVIKNDNRENAEEKENKKAENQRAAIKKANLKS